MCVVSCSVLSDSLGPHGLGPPGSSIHGISQVRIQGGLPFPPPEDLPGPGLKPHLLQWQAGFLFLFHH